MDTAAASAADAPIYIVGRRHSGTTFLDVALGSSDRIRSLGEIVTGLHNGEREVLAGGETLASSPFWSGARRLHRERTGRDLLEDGEWLYRLSSIKRFASALFADAATHPLWSRYRTLNRDLMDTLARCADGRRILDSNKEYTRGLMFLKGYERALVLHMVRNPVAIAGSHYYRIREKDMPVGFMKRHFRPGPFLFPVLMVTVGLSWTVGMVAAALTKARHPGRVLDISYERLCDDPAGEFRRIGAFLGVDLEPVVARIERGEPLSASHTVGGNELKLDGSFTFVPNAEGRRHLPAPYRWGIHLFALPGYALRRLAVRFD